MPSVRFPSLLLSLAAIADAQDVGQRLAAICTGRTPKDGGGFAVLVTHAGNTVHRAAYGDADTKNQIALRPEQRFYAASVAKSFTAACLVHLARAGKLSLADEVRQHLPELPEHCRGITLRHLMHHRSGLRDFYELEWLAGRDPSALTVASVLDLVRRQQGLNFRPGADFLYSNTGYLLIAEVVRRVSGRSLAEYSRQHLFAPLGMTASLFRDTGDTVVPDLPTPHAEAAPSRPPLLCGAGGMYTTVDDLERWLAALADRRWEPELTRELTTPPSLTPRERRSPQLNPYAGGLLLPVLGDKPSLLLLGGFGGWQAAALAMPQDRLRVVVLANSSIDALGIARELARATLGIDAPAAPANAAKPGFSAYRGDDGDLLFLATRRTGTSFFTTLGWKVEVTEQDGRFRSHQASTGLQASHAADGTLTLTVDGELPRRYLPVPSAPTGPEAAQGLAGGWHSDELAADIVLSADAGKLRIDGKRMLPIAPFQPLDRDTWISDTGMQIDVTRSPDGAPASLRISTARARGLHFTRR